MKYALILAATILTGATAQAEDLLQVDGKTITDADLPADVRSALYEARHEAYEKMNGELRQYAVRLMLAKEKDPKADPKKLPALDTFISKKEPTEADAKKMFEENKARLPPGATFDQLKPDIMRYLAEQSVREQFTKKLGELEKSGKIKVLAAAPVAPVVEFDMTPYASKGPADAKVTVVEVADYLCPHCQESHPEVTAMLKELGGKIKFVHVPYALRPDAFSGEMAAGAFCAKQQSVEAFWKYNDKAFEKKMAQSATADRPKVIEFAKEAGIDEKALEKCLGTEEPKKLVQKALADLSAVGVTGTPTFFINGRKFDMHGKLKDAVSDALAGKGQSH